LIDAIRAEERSDLLPALKALLESLIHVNAVDSHGRTPLAAALDPALSANGARYRHNNASERSKTLDYTIVDMLLASRSPETQGVSPEYSSILMDMRNTQLLETHFVAKKGFLRPNPAWSDGGDRYTLLCVAVASQNRQAIERFLALGAPWKFTDSNDRSISIFDWAKDPRHPYDTQLLEAVLKDRKEAAMDTE
jgi:hypothetical protein